MDAFPGYAKAHHLLLEFQDRVQQHILASYMHSTRNGWDLLVGLALLFASLRMAPVYLSRRVQSLVLFQLLPLALAYSNDLSHTVWPWCMHAMFLYARALQLAVQS